MSPQPPQSGHSTHHRSYEYLNPDTHYLIGRPLMCTETLRQALADTNEIQAIGNGALVLATIPKNAFTTPDTAERDPATYIQTRLKTYPKINQGSEEVRYRKDHVVWLDRFLTLSIKTLPNDSTQNKLLSSHMLVHHIADTATGQIRPRQTSARFALLGIQTDADMTHKRAGAIARHITRHAPITMRFGKVALLNPGQGRQVL